MPAIPRMMDANANRAREALRVMEDAARFALGYGSLSEQCKILRHDLRSALDLLPPGFLIANRDVQGDVGTEITTTSEMQRMDLPAVVEAAGKRLTEALRVLEETGKTINPDFATTIEQLRYRSYELDAVLMMRMGAGQVKQWQICVILTEYECLKPWREVVEESIAGGADCLQVREKNLTDRELKDRVKEIIDLARPHGVAVIVNDRADIALATRADGVHVGTNDLSITEIRAIAGTQLLIGATTHNLEEAELAITAGANYCGIGAMFPTKIKPGIKPSGPGYLRSFVDQFPGAPHLAIGGINPQNINKLVTAGCRGVAVCGAVCGSENPRRAVEELRTALEEKIAEQIEEAQV